MLGAPHMGSLLVAEGADLFGVCQIRSKKPHPRCSATKRGPPWLFYVPLGRCAVSRALSSGRETLCGPIFEMFEQIRLGLKPPTGYARPGAARNCRGDLWGAQRTTFVMKPTSETPSVALGGRTFEIRHIWN